MANKGRVSLVNNPAWDIARYHRAFKIVPMVTTSDSGVRKIHRLMIPITRESAYEMAKRGKFHHQFRGGGSQCRIVI